MILYNRSLSYSSESEVDILEFQNGINRSISVSPALFALFMCHIYLSGSLVFPPQLLSPTTDS
jgi:hypothetical protein